MPRTPWPLAHLELHTPDLAVARDFYFELLGWRSEQIRAGRRSYLTMDLGDGPSGGIVECAVERPLWLPYVGVPKIGEVTKRAEQLGAAVVLGPREGPAGWRSVVSAPDTGEIAFWQPKLPAGGGGMPTRRPRRSGSRRGAR